MNADPEPPLPSVEYEGYPYHKRYPFQGRAPAFGLVSDKTECPPDAPADEVLAVFPTAIAASIRAGRCSKLKDGSWPRYAWGRSSFRTVTDVTVEIPWEAKVVNRNQPSYKAYPVAPSRHSQTMPPHVRSYLWPSA